MDEINVESDDNELKEVNESKKAKYSHDNSVVSENDSCSICLEPWSIGGKHHICCLKCGHLFGKSCIEKWLKNKQNNNDKRCPTCNSHANLKDIRLLYIKSLMAVDKTDYEKLASELDDLKKWRKTHLDLMNVQEIKYQMMFEEIENLKKENSLLKSVTISSDNCNRETDYMPPVFKQEHSILTSKTGGCKLIKYCRNIGNILVTKTSPNSTLFPGYGLLKLSGLDLSSSEYIHLHSSSIKDVSINYTNTPMVMTVSLDKTIKITSLTSKCEVLKIKSEYPVWSSHWDKSNEFLVLTGYANGSIVTYDLRKHSEPYWQIGPLIPEQNTNDTTNCSSSPILSIKSLNICDETTNNSLKSAYVVSSLKNTYLVPKNPIIDTYNVINITKGFPYSLTTDETNNYALLSCRPLTINDPIKHTIFQLNSSLNQTSSSQTNEIYPKKLYQFFGGSCSTILSRNFLTNFACDSNDLNQINNKLTVCAGDEQTKSINLWTSSSNKTIPYLTIFNDDDVVQKNCVVDLEVIQPINSQPHLLLGLSDKRLTIYSKIN